MEIRPQDHFGLAAKIALSHGARAKIRKGEHIEDTEEFGNALVGLTKAINKFDPSRGFQFSTFAYYCICHEVERPQKKKRILSVSLGGQDVPDKNEYKKDETGQLVEEILKKVTNDLHKKILTDYYLKQKKLREIGAEIGVSKERVRQRREEALNFIREEILGVSL